MTEQTTQEGEGTTETQTQPMSRRMSERMSIVSRATHGVAAEVALDRETHESVDQIARAIESDEVIENEEVDESGETVESQGEAETPVVETGSIEDPLIDLVVFGQTVKMPKSKVDEMGGVAAAQILLAADHRMRQATQLASNYRTLHTELQQKLDEVKNLEKRLLEKSSAAGSTPSGQQQGGSNQTVLVDDALRAKVKETIGVMFEGDQEGAAKAFTDILALLPRGKDVSVEDLGQLVWARVEAKLAERQVEDNKKRLEANAEAERLEVNSLMKSKYKEINDNPELRAMALGLFNAARVDPRNKGRPLVTIADEVGQRVNALRGGGEVATQQTTTTTEINTRTHQKRRLPQASATSERSPTSEEKPNYPTSPSDVVKMFRAARGQPN